MKIRLDLDFFDKITKSTIVLFVRKRRKEIYKLDFIKTKNFFSKDTIKRVKKQTAVRKKICEIHMSPQRFISRIYKELLPTNEKQTTQYKSD